MDKKKKRNAYYLSINIQDAMRAVHDVVRVTPSNQIELGMTEYLNRKYKDILKARNIKL